MFIADFVYLYTKQYTHIMAIGKKLYRNRLRVILAEKEITNHWLAEQLGVSDMTLSRWTTNKIQPSMSQFVTISKLLNVDLNNLVEENSKDTLR